MNFGRSLNWAVFFQFLGKALTFTKDKVLTWESGMRKGVPKVLVVVTDGRSQDEVKKAAAVIQHSGKQRTPVSTSLRLGSHCWESLSLRFALY